MAKVDPNVYALEVSLTLDTALADSALEGFAQSIVDIEEQLTDAAVNVLTSVGDSINALNVGLVSVSDTMRNVNESGIEMEDNFAKVGEIITDMERYEKEHEERMLKEKKLLEEKLETYKELHDIIDEESDIRTQQLDDIDRFNKLIAAKNKLHSDETSMVQHESDITRQIGDNMRGVTDEVRRSDEAFKRLYTAVRDVMRIVMRFDEEAELFKEANYRAYGSMLELANSARSLSLEFNVLRGNALDAMKALIDTRAPRESIEKLAGTIGQAQRITGVASSEWAIFARSMRAAGMDTEATTKNMAIMMEAQRKLGLSTSDLRRQLSGASESAAVLGYWFGEDFVEKANVASLATAGWVKELGGSAESAQRLGDILKMTGMEAVMFYNTIGLSADLDPAERYDELGAAITRFATSWQPAIAGIDDFNHLTQEQSIALDMVAKKLGIHIDDLTLLIRRQHEIEKGNEAMIASHDAAMEKFADQIAINQLLQESYQSLGSQWNLLKDHIGALIGILAALVSKALYPVVAILNALVGAIDWVATKMMLLSDKVRELLGPFGFLVDWGQALIGVFIAAVAVTFMVGGAIAALSAHVYGLGKLLGGASEVASGFLDIIVEFSEAVGNVIANIMGGIAEGIGAIGEAAGKHAKGLLALGAAMLMVGAAAWLFADAVRTLTELDFGDMAASMGLLTVAMVTMMVALVVVANILTAGIPALLALGAAMLMIGAAAFLTGLGFKYVAESIVMLAGTIFTSPPLFIMFAMLSAGMAMFGIAALIAAPGVMVLAVAMITMSAALFVAGVAISMMAAALKMIGTELIVQFAEAMVDAAQYLIKSSGWFMLAGLVMVPAAVLLASGMSLLMVAAAVALAASVVMIAASFILLAGASALLVGAAMIMAAAAIIVLAGPSLMFGSMMMLIGSSTLLIASTIMVAAGAMIIAGAFAIGVGAVAITASVAAMLIASGFVIASSFGIFMASIALGFAAAALLGASMVLMVAGISALIGASSLMNAMAILSVSAVMIAVASAVLTVAVAEYLAPVASALLIAGAILLAGASALLAGTVMLAFVAAIMAAVAVPIMMAASILSVAAMSLIVATTIMAIAGMIMLAASSLFVSASTLLAGAAVGLAISVATMAMASVAMIVVAPMISAGALAIAFASGVLMASAVTLAIAGAILLPAAFVLWLAAGWIELAFNKLSSAIMVIDIAKDIIDAVVDAFGAMANMLDKVSNISVPGLFSVASGITTLAYSFVALGSSSVVSAAMNSLSRLFGGDVFGKLQSISDMAPGVRSAATAMSEFVASIDDLDNAVESIADIADSIGDSSVTLADALSTLSSIGDAIDFDSIGVTLEEQLESVATILDEYANKIELAADRINEAVELKAAAAMRAAENTGIADAVKTGAIAQVELIPPEGADRDKEQLITLLREQNILLRELIGVASQVKGTDDVGKIVDILDAYLPVMVADDDEGLQSELNSVY